MSHMMRGPIAMVVALVVSFGLTAQPSALAADGEIPQAGRLAEIAALSKQQAVPTIVFVSRDACPYCRALRNSILAPMLAAGKFGGRGNLVEVRLDATDPFSGFEGGLMMANDFAGQYKAVITPTLLFLDADGRELSKRRVGISNLELYGFYLNQSIDEALSKLAGRQ